jgi:hypothetical protein
MPGKTIEPRQCLNCQELKSVDDFYKLGAGRLDSWCKKCKKAKRRSHYDLTNETGRYRNTVKLLAFIYEVEDKQLSLIDRQLEEILTNARTKAGGSF